jgi:hypothetical protein
MSQPATHRERAAGHLASARDHVPQLPSWLGEPGERKD